MHDLIAAVDALRCEVQVLREVLDEIREDFSWALKNRAFGGGTQHVVHLTSMPADPLAADFGERINRLKPEDLPPESPEQTASQGQPRQQQMWE